MARYWEGKLVRLRGIEPGDVDVHFEVDQEDDVSRFQWIQNPPVALARTAAWVEGASKEGGKHDEFTGQIVSLADVALVGSITTHHADARAGVFSYGLHVEAKHRGKGYASEAVLLVLRYYFQELRYQKCNVEAMAINVPSQRLHERLGFEVEGRRRQVVYTSGQHSDMVLYGMTLEEFRERHADYWRDEPTWG